MPIDASLYSQFAPRVRSVSDFENGLAQQQTNQLAMQTGNLDLAQKRQGLADQNALRGLLSDPSVDLNTPGGQSRLWGAAPTLAGKVLGDRATLAKTTADTGFVNAQADVKRADMRDKSLAYYRDVAGTLQGPQDAAAFVTSSYHDPVIGPILQQRGSLEDAISRIGTTPEQFKTWQANTSIGIEKLAQLLKTNQVNQGNRTTTQVFDPVTRQTSNVASAPINQSPDNAATNATSRANNAATQAGENQRSAASRDTQLTIAGLNPDGTSMVGGGALSPEAIDNAAHRYNLDGTLPPSMGRGVQGTRDIRAIQNRAAELTQGQDGTDLRVNQLGTKSLAAGLTTLTKAQQMAGNFEKTANMNADLALSLSAKMDRTGIPLLNAGLQALKTGTGSPEATQFAASITTFTGEYAKIMSGGMGGGQVSDAARAKASALLTSSMTKEQFAGNVKLLQTEMKNRMTGYEDQANELRSHMKRQGPAPEARPAANSGINIDPAAIAAELKRRGH